MKEVVPILFDLVGRGSGPGANCRSAGPGRFIILRLLAVCRAEPGAVRPKRRRGAGNRLRRRFYNLPAGADR